MTGKNFTIRRARCEGSALVWWLSETWDEAAHGFYAALGATHDPVIAHALDGAAFEKLAGENDGEEHET